MFDYFGRTRCQAVISGTFGPAGVRSRRKVEGVTEVKWFRKDRQFNQPLPEKGQVIKEKIIIRMKESVMKMECDQHGYMQVWFFPVENPYYATVGKDATYTIDEVPAGKYELVVWQPILGIKEKRSRSEPEGKWN